MGKARRDDDRAGLDATQSIPRCGGGGNSTAKETRTRKKAISNCSRGDRYHMRKVSFSSLIVLPQIFHKGDEAIRGRQGDQRQRVEEEAPRVGQEEQQRRRWRCQLQSAEERQQEVTEVGQGGGAGTRKSGRKEEGEEGAFLDAEGLLQMRLLRAVVRETRRRRRRRMDLAPILLSQRFF